MPIVRKRVIPQPSEEDLKWAAEALEKFRFLRGYPDPKDYPETFRTHAEALLRIVWRKPISEIIHAVHDDIPGNPIDGDWLIVKALDCFDHYPLPVELREIYQEYLPTRDGQEYFRGR